MYYAAEIFRRAYLSTFAAEHIAVNWFTRRFDLESGVGKYLICRHFQQLTQYHPFLIPYITMQRKPIFGELDLCSLAYPLGCPPSV